MARLYVDKIPLDTAMSRKDIYTKFRAERLRAMSIASQSYMRMNDSKSKKLSRDDETLKAFTDIASKSKQTRYQNYIPTYSKAGKADLIEAYNKTIAFNREYSYTSKEESDLDSKHQEALKTFRMKYIKSENDDLDVDDWERFFDFSLDIQNTYRKYVYYSDTSRNEKSPSDMGVRMAEVYGASSKSIRQNFDYYYKKAYDIIRGRYDKPAENIIFPKKYIETHDVNNAVMVLRFIVDNPTLSTSEIIKHFMKE